MRESASSARKVPLANARPLITGNESRLINLIIITKSEQMYNKTGSDEERTGISGSAFPGLVSVRGLAGGFVGGSKKRMRTVSGVRESGGRRSAPRVRETDGRTARTDGHHGHHRHHIRERAVRVCPAGVTAMVLPRTVNSFQLCSSTLANAVHYSCPPLALFSACPSQRVYSSPDASGCRGAAVRRALLDQLFRALS